MVVCGLQKWAPSMSMLLHSPCLFLPSDFASAALPQFPPSVPILIPNQARKELCQGFSWSRNPSLSTLVHTVFPLMLYMLAFTPARHKNTLLSTNVLMLPDCLSSLLSQHVYFIRKQALVCISVIHKVCYIQNGHIILSNEPDRLWITGHRILWVCKARDLE